MGSMGGSRFSTVISGLQNCTEMNSHASARHGERSNGVNGFPSVTRTDIRIMLTRSTLTVSIPVYYKGHKGYTGTGKPSWYTSTALCRKYDF